MILNSNNIMFDDISNISNIFYIYISLLTKTDNDLIYFIIQKLSEILDKNELSFNIREDFFNIINKLISELFADSKGLSITKLLYDIIPKFLKIIKIDENRSYETFVNFINNMFTNKSSGLGKEIDLFFRNQKKPTKPEMMGDKKPEVEVKPEMMGEKKPEAEVKPEMKKKNKKKYRIIFPKFSTEFSNLALLFKDREKIKGVY